MPSKSQTGNSPLGSTKLGSSSGFVRTEQEMARRTPTYPSDQVWINLPNGRMYQPRARGRRVIHPWKLSVRLDIPEGQKAAQGTWKYRVILGLLNNAASNDFVDNIYEGNLVKGVDNQIGLKVKLKAPVNAADYVMPGSDPTFPTLPETEGSIQSIVAEEFYDFEFVDLDLPNAKVPDGFAVVPIGSILWNADSESFSVGVQVLNNHISGIFSPVNGYVVY